jgi:hypothetical protein
MSQNSNNTSDINNNFSKINIDVKDYNPSLNISNMNDINACGLKLCSFDDFYTMKNFLHNYDLSTFKQYDHSISLAMAKE